MTSEAGVAVNVLTSAQIHDLVEALPELPGSWAKLAGTDPGLLSQGNPRAHAALRAAFAHNHALLLAELVRIGMPRVLAALDGSEGDEEFTDFAAAAGQVLGAAAVPVFLAAVASGADPFSLEVAGRLAELRDTAVRAATTMGWESSTGGRAQATATSTADSPPAALAHFVSVNSPRPGSPSAGDGETEAGPAAPPVIVALMARTAELLELGATLAERIRMAADDVTAGFPALSAGRELTTWSVAVEEHLAGAARMAAGAGP